MHQYDDTECEYAQVEITDPKRSTKVAILD